MVIKINNQNWHVKVLSDYVFSKHFGRDTLGLTCYDLKSSADDARTIFFNKRYFKRTLIIHELLHAYLAYQPTKKKLRRETFEEVFCEFFERHFDAVAKHADAIEKYFKQ